MENGKNLKCISIYYRFLFESVDRHVNTFLDKSRPYTPFSPNVHFMGTPKRNESVREYAEFLKSKIHLMHSNEEERFQGISSQWWSREIEQNKAYMVDGIYVGIKSIQGKPILLEHMMEDHPLDICPVKTLGILIPMNDVLKRTKYQWFAVMNMTDVLKTNTSLAKYMQLSLAEKETFSGVVEEEPGPAISL